MRTANVFLCRAACSKKGRMDVTIPSLGSDFRFRYTVLPLAPRMAYSLPFPHVLVRVHFGRTITMPRRQLTDHIAPTRTSKNKIKRTRTTVVSGTDMD